MAGSPFWAFWFLQSSSGSNLRLAVLQNCFKDAQSKVVPNAKSDAARVFPAYFEINEHEVVK